MKQTTKHCPKCRNTHLILTRTLNKKFCSDCGLAVPWYLEEGQAAVLEDVKLINGERVKK